MIDIRTLSRDRYYVLIFSIVSYLKQT